jgi:hypothetical protein
MVILQINYCYCYRNVTRAERERMSEITRAPIARPAAAAAE